MNTCVGYNAASQTANVDGQRDIEVAESSTLRSTCQNPSRACLPPATLTSNDSIDRLRRNVAAAMSTALLANVAILLLWLLIFVGSDLSRGEQVNMIILFKSLVAIASLGFWRLIRSIAPQSIILEVTAVIIFLVTSFLGLGFLINLIHDWRTSQGHLHSFKDSFVADFSKGKCHLDTDKFFICEDKAIEKSIRSLSHWITYKESLGIHINRCLDQQPLAPPELVAWCVAYSGTISNSSDTFIIATAFASSILLTNLVTITIVVCVLARWLATSVRSP